MTPHSNVSEDEAILALAEEVAYWDGLDNVPIPRYAYDPSYDPDELEDIPW